MEKNNMKRASTLPSECTTIIVGDQMSNDSSHFADQVILMP